MGLVKRGGRRDYVCTNCGTPIPAKEPYYRVGVGDSTKSYHLDCQPSKKEKKETSPTMEQKPTFDFRLGAHGGTRYRDPKTGRLTTKPNRREA